MTTDHDVDHEPLLERLPGDLDRPGGGWTMGALTLLLAGAAPLLQFLGHWPFPHEFVAAHMALALLAHMLWGAYGYYPRGF